MAVCELNVTMAASPSTPTTLDAEMLSQGHLYIPFHQKPPG